MKPADTPILFNSPMVKALLAGQKTQTRRILTDVTLRAHAGERMWVREKFSAFKHAGSPSELSSAAYVLFADGTQRTRDGRTTGPLHAYVEDGFEHMRWRPAIHMPRWASRIALVVTEVRAQRLQDISEHDARAEGVVAVPFCRAGRADGLEHVESFELLWDSINGERPGCSWADNPWVIARTFTVEDEDDRGTFARIFTQEDAT